MGIPESKVRWCLDKAKKEGRKHRGLREISPDFSLAARHITKAEHNLQILALLLRERAFDWAVSASFYAQYHCLLALLAAAGYESRNQECTFAAIEMLITEGKLKIDPSLVRRIANRDSEDALVTLRETYQYGTETELHGGLLQELERETRECIEATKIALEKRR